MKAKEIAELSTAELHEKLGIEEENFLKLRLNHAVSDVENPMLLRTKRRTIARLKTELHKRELVQEKTTNN